MSAPSTLRSSSARSAARRRLFRAFGGVCRLTFPNAIAPKHALLVVALLALLAVAGTGMVQSPHGVRTYLRWMIESYFTLLVPLLAFVTAGGVVRDEMKPATLDYVLIRPLPRAAFVGFKYVAHLLIAEVEFLLGAMVLIVIGIVRHAPGVTAAIPSLLVAEVCLVAGFTAFGFACGAITSRYVVVGLVYAAIVEGGIGQIPTQLSRLSMTHQARAALLPLIDSLPATGIQPMIISLAVFTVAALAVAAAVFHVRELSPAPDA